MLSLRGQGARALRLEIEACGGIQAGDVLIRAVAAYEYSGTLVTSTACPTQDAAKRITLATGAYAKVSGHFLLSKTV